MPILNIPAGEQPSPSNFSGSASLWIPFPHLNPFSPITTGKVFTSTHIPLFFSYNLHIATKLFLCFAWTIISCFVLSSTSVGAPNLSKSVLTFFVEIVVSVILASNKTKTTPIKKLTKYLIS